MRHSFRFSGTGGQGLITAGIILAEAALLDDKLAVQSQSYGPEARGGSSKAEAIISDEPIYFSRVICPDTLLVMSQEAANKFIADCDEHTTVITDTLFVALRRKSVLTSCTPSWVIMVCHVSLSLYLWLTCLFCFLFHFVCC